MKSEASNELVIRTMYVDGVPIEINVDDVSIEDLQSCPDLLDGFHLCPDCRDFFVLAGSGSCSSCKRINDRLEARRLLLSQPVDRIDRGVVPHVQAPPEEVLGTASPWTIAMLFLGGVLTSTLIVGGLWFFGRLLIKFCLDHS